MAFETLRLRAETTAARMAHPEWDGWSVNRRGELCSPDDTVCLPESAVHSYHFMVANIMPALRSDIRQLRKDLDDARESLRKANEIVQAVDDAHRMTLAKAIVRALFETELPKDGPDEATATPATCAAGAILPALPIPPKRATLADAPEIDLLLNLSHQRRNTP
ncbi:MAG: hypothetical protein GC151_13095 [Betaproteobacteria bacterium]|nr:hypothetical protein [Betaproteobacteria bacterium]